MSFQFYCDARSTILLLCHEVLYFCRCQWTSWSVRHLQPRARSPVFIAHPSQMASMSSVMRWLQFANLPSSPVTSSRTTLPVPRRWTSPKCWVRPCLDHPGQTASHFPQHILCGVGTFPPG